MFKKWPFSRKSGTDDYSTYFGEIPLTPKQRLIEKCKKNNVAIYVDNACEASTGIYAELRGVASEAELQRRLNTKAAVAEATHANRIALLALGVAFVALVKSFFFP